MTSDDKFGNVFTPVVFFLNAVSIDESLRLMLQSFYSIDVYISITRYYVDSYLSSGYFFDSIYVLSLYALFLYSFLSFNSTNFFSCFFRYAAVRYSFFNISYGDIWCMNND